MEYNSRKYIQLLKYSGYLKSEGKSIWDEKEKFFELNQYGQILDDHFFWENRKTYQTLIQNYLSGIIKIPEFETKFLQIYRIDKNISENMKEDFNQLENFLPDPKSKGFGSLIITVFEDLDYLNYAFEPKETYEISESQFLASLQKTFFQMLKYFDSENQV